MLFCHQHNLRKNIYKKGAISQNLRSPFGPSFISEQKRILEAKKCGCDII